MQDALREKMTDLIEKLNKASEAYYGGKDEIMSNYEWDAMFDELSRLEEETGTVLPDSPTRKVSSAADENIAGAKETHEFPALSLAKTKKVEELQAWAGNLPVWLSWKLDGLTLVLTYDDMPDLCAKITLEDDENITLGDISVCGEPNPGEPR